MTDIKTITPPQSLSGATQRQEWIDCLRGVTMLLVVIGHCDLWLTGWFSAFSLISNIYQLPLFFFISGLFAYSAKLSPGNPEEIAMAVWRRIKMVLWPTIIILAAYYCCFLMADNSIADIAADQYKGGYWFTIVVVEIYVLALPFILLINSTRMRRRWAFAIIVAAMIVFAKAGNEVSDIFRDHYIMGWTSLHFVFSYMPYFLLGMMARLIMPGLRSRVTSPWLPLITVIVCLVTLIVMPVLRHGVLDWRIMPLLSLLMLGLFMTFSNLRGALNASTPYGRLLSTIGRNTLPIYLFHYFILSFLSLAVGDTLSGISFARSIGVLPLTIALAIAISLGCVGIDRLLSTLRIRKYIFPGRP